MSTLVFSPHIDDEVLGCFAFLEAGTHVVFGGVESRPGMSAAIRIGELEASSAALGFRWTLLENPVNAYAAAALSTPFENLVRKLEPTTVLLPHPSYNADHRAVYDAALIATRPHDSLPRVDEVLVFEQPHVVLWPHGQSFEPNVFVEIDADEKLLAYTRYASQVRGHRSPDCVRALAVLRGAAIGRPAAEAYRALRIVRARGARRLPDQSTAAGSHTETHTETHTESHMELKKATHEATHMDTPRNTHADPRTGTRT